jgi:pimeloyl-ACP methyl ester carboxylesterase
MHFTCSINTVHVSDTKTEKKPLVLLHGYLETLQIWDTFNLLTEDAFRVIAPDLPGHGLTGTYNVNTVEKQADMLFEYLERQQIGTVLLAGHSMGGYVAQSFAMRYPGKVSALVLMHAVPWPDSDEKKAARDRDIEKIQMGKLEQVAQRDVPLMYAPGNRKRLNEIIESTLVQAGIHDPAGIVASLKE